MEELVYTSAPQGLLPGTTGFCTVEMTEGIPTEIMESLESLSSYDNEPSKTVNWMHVRLQSTRGMRHVMSRVGPLQGEFSGRTNKLAHHICLVPDELPRQGPMQVVGPGGPLQQQWSGQVRRLAPQPGPNNLRPGSMPRTCRSWESAVGDAGLAGAVLSRLRGSGESPLWLIRRPEIDALAMTDELLALLPGPERWQITFCTYLHPLPRSAECRLRWVLPESPAMRQLQNLGPEQLVDLRHDADTLLGGADQALVEAARNGVAIAAPHERLALPRGLQDNVPRRRAVTQVDLADPTFDCEADASEVTPTATLPPQQRSSVMRPALIIAAIGIIPACVWIVFAMHGDPSPAAATSVRDVAEPAELPSAELASREPGPALVESAPIAAAIEVKPPPKEARTARPNRRKQNPPPMIKPVVTKTAEKARQTVAPVPIKMPSSALTLSLDQQTLYEGTAIDAIELRRVASMLFPIDFRLTAPDPSGVRDLNAVAPSTGEQRRMGTIHTEPDRVMFAWSPNVKPNVASSFLLAHEFLISDQKRLTTVPLGLAQPISVTSLGIPESSTDITIPAWILPDFDCWARPTVYSSLSEHGVQVARFHLKPASSAKDPTWRTVRQDLSGLEDPIIKRAMISIAGDIIEQESLRRIRISTKIELDGGQGASFQWANRERVIREQTEKHNQRETSRQNDATKRNMMISTDRKQVIDKWGESLRCELELFARINGRDIRWGKTGGGAE